MREFDIHIHSFQDIQEFVALATVQPFSVVVGNENQQVNGKSFSGMVTLDYNRPTFVRAECAENDWMSFERQVKKFLA